jgi:hypothetical protein
MWYNFSNCRIGKNKKTGESAPVVEEDKDSLKEAELQFKMREEAVRNGVPISILHRPHTTLYTKF